MAGSRRIVVEFLGKDQSLGRTAKDVEGKTSRLGSRMKSVGKIAAVGFAGGAIVAGKALFEMGKNAAEDEAAQRRLKVALKNTTGANDQQVASVEDWISKQGVALGVTDDELRPAFQRLAQATGDIGEAQRLSKIAMDASAGSGKSLKTVTEAMAKAQNGNLGALSRLGVQIKNTDGSMKTFTEVTKEMSNTFGGQASAQANSFQGRMDRLKLMFDETKETIGAKLLPVVGRLADWFLNKGLPAVSRLSASLKENLGPAFAVIRRIAAKVLAVLSGDFRKHFKSIQSIVRSAVSIITSLWRIFGGSLTKGIRGAFVAIRTIVGGAFKVVRGIFQTFAALLKGDWRGVWNGIKTILSGAWQVIRGTIGLIWNGIKTAFRLGRDALFAIFGSMWDGLRDRVSSGFGRVLDFIRGIPGKIKDVGGMFKDAGRWLIDKMLDGIRNASGFVSDIGGNIWSAVKRLINSGIDRINAALEFTVKIPGAPDIHVNPPNIPHLARGGIVRARPGGTLALIGEGGHDEAVVPLTGPHAPRVASAGGTQTYVVDLRIDGKTVRKLLLKEKRRGGGLELGLA